MNEVDPNPNAPPAKPGQLTPVADPKPSPRTVVCRYVGLDTKIDALIKTIAGREPNSADFGFPSANGEIYRVRIIKFKTASQEEAAHLLSLLHPIAGVEQFAE